MNSSKASSSAMYGYKNTLPSIYNPKPNEGSKTNSDIGVGYGGEAINTRKACGIVKKTNQFCGV
jgi:hypothetical protein